MRAGLIVILAILAAGCGEPPDTDLKLLSVESPPAVGLSLRELPPPVLKSIGLSYGLAVVRADGMARKAGLRMGDVVYGVNEQRLRNLDDFRRLVAQPGGGANVSLLVRRGKTDFYVTMDLAAKPAAPGSRDTLLRT